jgi:hypothetical protein
MYTFSPLKGFNSINDATVTNLIQDGLIEYFDYALLDKGNYYNVDFGETAPNGEDYSRLRLSSNDQYVSGQVWEGFRGNWVWQSGLTPDGKTPPNVGTNKNYPGISGVYVNGNFQPTSGEGTYAHYVDYFNGRVVFDSPIPTGSTVQAEFSYKYINVVYANNMPWLRETQKRTMQPTANFLGVSEGAWDMPPESRLQLPAIAIEAVPQRRFKGYQLGGGQWVYSDIIFHCIAEDEYTRNLLLDIVSNQNDKNIFIPDSNMIDSSGAYPLDQNGTPVPSALQYPELINDYSRGSRIRLTKANISDMFIPQSELYGGTVRMTAELIKSNI